MVHDAPTGTGRSRVSDRISSASRVHIAILVVVGAALVIESSRGWFFSDDWAFLVPDGPGPWAPHVGHWSTIPWLVFQALRGTVGLDSYVPFAVPAIVAHLVVVHLLWRIALRLGVRGGVATATTGVVAVLGSGAENIGWAFQVGFVGAIALCLGAILLLLSERGGPVPPLVATLLCTIAVATSGTSLALLPSVAVVAVLRYRGRGLAIVLPALAAWGSWWWVVGRTASSAGHATWETAWPALLFAGSLLGAGMGRPLPLPSALWFLLPIGGVVALVYAARRGGRFLTAAAIAIAAPVFAAATAVSRVGMGLDTASSSRYVYFVVVATVPLSVLLLESLIRRWHRIRYAVLAVVVLLAIYNAAGLVVALGIRESRTDSIRQAFTASLSWPAPRLGVRPSPRWAPDVTAEDIRELVSDGLWHPR